MSNKSKIIYVLILIFISLISLDFFNEKFENELLKQQFLLSNNEFNRIENYQLTHLDPKERIRNFSYNTIISSGKYKVGDNLDLPSAWYSFTNNSNEEINLKINNTSYKLNSKYKASLGTTMIELYINQGDEIQTTGNIQISRTKLFTKE